VFLCLDPQTSFFKYVFDEKKDFNNQMPYELTEKEQIQRDPVGFFYMHKVVVYAILSELKQINARRTDLRDLLRDMGWIWRWNNQQHQVLNEPDWTTRDEVARRVTHLIQITRKKLGMQEKVDNLVTGDIIRNWELLVPEPYPTVTTEKMSRILQLQVPHIESVITPPPFAPVAAFNRRVFLRGTTH
jgi:hypothetical protein